MCDLVTIFTMFFTEVMKVFRTADGEALYRLRRSTRPAVISSLAFRSDDGYLAVALPGGKWAGPIPMAAGMVGSYGLSKNWWCQNAPLVEMFDS